ncbi:MAG: hypothetical protein LBJ03_01005, partial [Holosporales bacterium]|nr:hypothetical protein [Holosporales bacterium]
MSSFVSAKVSGDLLNISQLPPPHLSNQKAYLDKPLVNSLVSGRSMADICDDLINIAADELRSKLDSGSRPGDRLDGLGQRQYCLNALRSQGAAGQNTGLLGGCLSKLSLSSECKGKQNCKSDGIQPRLRLVNAFAGSLGGYWDKESGNKLTTVVGAKIETVRFAESANYNCKLGSYLNKIRNFKSNDSFDSDRNQFVELSIEEATKASEPCVSKPKLSKAQRLLSLSEKEGGKARDQQQARVRISRSSAAAKSDGTQPELRLGGRKDLLDGYNKTSARLSESLSRFGNTPLTKQLRSLSGFLDGYISTSDKSSFSQKASLVGTGMKSKVTSSEETNMNIIRDDRSRKSPAYLGKLGSQSDGTQPELRLASRIRKPVRRIPLRRSSQLKSTSVFFLAAV